MAEELPEVRIGDRERREVDARLQDALADGVLTLTEYDERAAACWAARTQSDLDVLTRDLPTRHATAAASGPPVATGVPGRHRVTAVLSESELGVPVLPGQDVQATAVLGTADVDLRREDLPRELTVRATAVMGEVKVHVPPGTTVHVTGGAVVLGDRKVRTGGGSADGSLVRLDATAVLGTVSVDDAPRAGGLLPATAHHVPASAPMHGPPAHRGIGGRIVAALGTVAAAGALAVGGVAVIGADDGAAVFGSRVEHADVGDTIEVGVLFGSVQVVVPEGASVDTSGLVVFGSVEGDRTGTAGDVEVEARGAFGSVEVVTQREFERRNR